MSDHNHLHSDHDHHDHGHDHHHNHNDHDHHHGFGFGHQHTHAPANFGKAFALGITLNTLYIGAEVFWGIWAHSLSLLADAGHNLSDVLGLGAAWLAETLARRAPTTRFTYGLRRSTILAALINATILLLVTGGIIWEACIRLFSHTPVQGTAVSWVAFIGILVNGLTALLFMRGASKDLNIRGAFLHMASDAVMSLAVVIAGIIIAWTGFAIIDPIVSLVVSLSIVIGTWSLMRSSLELSLDAVPQGISPEEVRTALLSISHVTGLHHLHIWAMSTTETALTVHLTSNATSSHDTRQILTEATLLLRSKFNISHPTFQIETSVSTDCVEQKTCC
ncbi:cation diffusion facilitator family transporter [Swingsia samuiensis]|uniref:Cation transporter n=1 Tax=Swingsia samuiensis TaxID=1293412 RepID=A0A4Y6UI46_9PROT|nr:cation diffusion facilitator family transporter [Swingsia samuiensis]QDH17243.1 cation transporter [Swingsia samuiensis]